MAELSDAIKALCPGAFFSHSTQGYSKIAWHSKDIEQPTESECNAKLAELQAASDARAYARSRQAEYPSIEDCIHAILDNELEALQVKRQAVKSKYPKP